MANNEFYTVDIAGVKRDLPVCPLNEKLSIAAFVLFGDVEITAHAAKELLARVPDFDFILTPEAKSIPLAYEMSRQSGKKYFVARKKEKVYMKDPVKVDVQSITTKGVQTLILDSKDGEELRGKRIILVDDVISTGESLRALEKLAEVFGAEVVAKTAVLAEGDAFNRTDLTVLGLLPLIEN